MRYFRFLFRLLNDTEIAKAQRDFELKKAAYDVEVRTKVLKTIRMCIELRSVCIS